MPTAMGARSSKLHVNVENSACIVISKKSISIKSSSRNGYEKLKLTITKYGKGNLKKKESIYEYETNNCEEKADVSKRCGTNQDIEDNKNKTYSDPLHNGIVDQSKESYNNEPYFSSKELPSTACQTALSGSRDEIKISTPGDSSSESSECYYDCQRYPMMKTTKDDYTVSWDDDNHHHNADKLHDNMLDLSNKLNRSEKRDDDEPCTMNITESPPNTSRDTAFKLIHMKDIESDFSFRESAATICSNGTASFSNDSHTAFFRRSSFGTHPIEENTRKEEYCNPNRHVDYPCITTLSTSKEPFSYQLLAAGGTGSEDDMDMTMSNLKVQIENVFDHNNHGHLNEDCNENDDKTDTDPTFLKNAYGEVNEEDDIDRTNMNMSPISIDSTSEGQDPMEHGGSPSAGLQGYFKKLENGFTPSLEEQMTYEWLRFKTFSTYSGGGSPIHLARSGFYHTHNNKTQCFCCNASYSNWTYTDNVQEIHRRISPNCPFVNGGAESNGNISVRAACVQNEPNQVIPGNIGNSSTQVPASTQRPTLPVNHGGFSSGTGIGSPVSGETTTTSTTVAFGFNTSTVSARPNPGFSFSQTSGTTGCYRSEGTASTTRTSEFHLSMTSNSQEPSCSGFSQNASQQTGGATGGTVVTTQLRGLVGGLTIQQSTGVQQPSDEPISGNPVVAPTQPQRVLRQADGDSLLTVSAQQQPETNELRQSSARSQRPGEDPGSGAVAPQRENADLIQLGPLKHSGYSTMETRMSSFQSWPNYLNQTPRQMAYAGFFHPGVADFARCFCCGGGLRNWEADDDPMVEHARWYPRCEYINKLKGTHFIQAVLRRHREHMAERQRQQETAQNQTTFLTPDPMSTSVAANLLEMGFTQDRAREAILTVRRLRGRSEVSVEEVMAWILDEDTAPRDEPTRTGATAGGRDTVGNSPAGPPRSRSPAKSNSSGSESAAVGRQDSDSHTSVEDAQGTKTDTQGATGGAEFKGNLAENKSGEDDSSSEENDKSSKENISSNKKPTKDKSAQSRKDKSKRDKQSRARKEHSPGPSEGASLLSHGDVDTKSLKAENKVLKQMQVCKICMDKYVSVTFLPCGHLVCCGDCAKSMRKCPICRKRIKGQVRTFMS